MLQIKNVSKQYEELKVLDQINLNIESNQTTVIIGPSGSGKTTLLRCMNLLAVPDSGEIDLNGTSLIFDPKAPIQRKKVIDFRKKTGMVFQGFNLFSHRTVIENIMEGPVTVLKKKKQEAREEGILLLQKVGLEEKANQYPRQLSGGQQQRVAIARALAMKPEVLLFDEPTSALDPELEIEVLEMIKTLVQEQYTIVIVTHKMAFAKEISDHIIFLEQGKVVKQGSYSELYHSGNERISKFLTTLQSS
ncbi:amino acid ABC transporter ATP-binding protein [Sinanaerobacter chloroacetimidivorans]|jgi:cystine transport system ATP-binding protein|uniref:Amino acid ABC transporter ATP-binding protein n=1 Tax=Sinanaerobacter chloroacetimidivorans TaxID=2818044 RepID=A0A8J7W320_9FIRM|nr:amino acid ABC transporter ATP-binding protein [Sinanaerobacter chloroacetimidivorans]MBR0599466.1 amino acid ABC transporter ATP-binding protein [Sinanaerobacter chloroacetimidivorans]